MATDVREIDWFKIDNPIVQELAWRAGEKDIRLFLSKAWKIKVPGGPPRTLDPWKAQDEILSVYENEEKVLSLKARQIGWTTITTAYVGHDVIYNEWHPWLFVSRTGGAAVKNLGMVAYGLRNLPTWMKDRIDFDNWRITTEMIEMSNGSWIESVAATGGTGRGDAVWGVMWDEAAFPEAAESMYAALEPLQYGKFFVLSTANGMGNWFHAKWLDTQLPGSEWVGVFKAWYARKGRDDTWYEKKKRDYRGQPWLFFQEYPETPEEAFAKSGRAAIGSDLLDQFHWADTWERLGWDGEAFTIELDPYNEEYALVVDVFERPTVERHPVHGYALRPPNYVLFCDPAEGLEHGDATAIVVYDANTGTCVARVQTHYMLEGIPEVVAALGYWYHNALVAVERQNHGFFVNHTLANVLHYPRLYRMAELSKVKTGKRSMQYGWSTNASTKPKMVRDFLRMLRARVNDEIEEEGIDPVDPVLRHEAATFVIDDQGRYGASGTNHDDVIIAHMGATQLLIEVHKYPVVWRDEKKKHTTMAELDEIAFGGSKSRGGLRIGGRGRSSVKQGIMVTPRT